MTKIQMIEAIIKTYDEEMIKKYAKWLNRQSKNTIQTIYNIRINK